MKIAFLSFYSGCVYRGVETFVHCVANELVKLGNDVTVFQVGDIIDGAKYKTVQLESDVDWESKRNYIPFINHFALKIMQFTKAVLKQIDLETDIIFPTNGQWQSLLCSFWAKRYNKKIVISGQSGPGLDDRINLLTFPDVFVSLTNHQMEWAKKVNPFIKHFRTSNGVLLEDFNGSKKLEDKLEKPIILSVAALDRWKRNDLTINAVSKIKKGTFLLVGNDGPDRERLLGLGKKLLPNRFRIMTFKHKDMPKVYSTANVLVFPTVPWESFGIVLLEAMASNLPVVCTDDPIRREIVGDAGIFVDPTNTEEFANAIEKALNTNWGDLPRKQAEKFSWEKISKQYEDLFKSLVK